MTEKYCHGKVPATWRDWSESFLNDSEVCDPSELSLLRPNRMRFVELELSSSSGRAIQKKAPTGDLLLYGAPGEIRTPDHLVRSQVLYPAELRAHRLITRCADLLLIPARSTNCTGTGEDWKAY